MAVLVSKAETAVQASRLGMATTSPINGSSKHSDAPMRLESVGSGSLSGDHREYRGRANADPPTTNADRSPSAASRVTPRRVRSSLGDADVGAIGSGGQGIAEVSTPPMPWRSNSVDSDGAWSTATGAALGEPAAGIVEFLSPEEEQVKQQRRSGGVPEQMSALCGQNHVGTATADAISNPA